MDVLRMVHHTWNIAPSCGLVCFMDDETNKEMYICNPITREYETLSTPPSPGFLVYSALAFSVDHSKSKYTIYVIRSMQASEDFFLWNVSTHIYNSIEKTCYNLDDTEASVGVLRDESVIPEPCALTCGRLMEVQRKLVLVGGMGRPDRPGVIKGIGIWVLDGKEWTEITRMPHKYAHGFGELDDVFASSGVGDLIYIQSYGETALLVYDMSMRQWSWSQKCAITTCIG
ncbi:F-box/kelch-repeat protein-like protein [Tanacetum coccineum]